jgi:hypothetical protein
VWWHTPIILGAWEADIGRIMVQGEPRVKSSQDPISTNCWAWWCAPVIPAMAGSVNRRIVDWGSWGKKARPYFQNIQSINGWRYGSGNRLPVYQVRSPEFKPYYCQKNKKESLLCARPEVGVLDAQDKMMKKIRHGSFPNGMRGIPNRMLLRGKVIVNKQ